MSKTKRKRKSYCQPYRYFVVREGRQHLFDDPYPTSDLYFNYKVFYTLTDAFSYAYSTFKSFDLFSRYNLSEFKVLSVTSSSPVSYEYDLPYVTDPKFSEDSTYTVLVDFLYLHKFDFSF